MTTHYTVIGGGRLARHFAHYFSLLGIAFNQWQRASDSSASLSEKLTACSHVLLLISDSAIPEFLQEHPYIREKTIIHCSGAHSFPGLAGVHPLMSFGEELYPLSTYVSIPMVCEQSDLPGSLFEDLFPQLDNPVYSITKEQKPRYHAYCVSAGNLTQIIMQYSSAGIENMGLPAEILHGYLRQSLGNYINQGAAALTGPIARADQLTIDANLIALKGQPLEAIYRQIAKHYQSAERPVEHKELAA